VPRNEIPTDRRREHRDQAGGQPDDQQREDDIGSVEFMVFAKLASPTVPFRAVKAETTDNDSG